VQPTDKSLPILTGFENHQGLTDIGDGVTPLGKVLSGVGNGFNKTEGVWQGNVIGTYMHGPGLARNPELADAILESALDTKLTNFADPFAQALANERRSTLTR
jgi:CobQ-like glutamine amidotransferase family enzyme